MTPLRPHGNHDVLVAQVHSKGMEAFRLGVYSQVNEVRFANLPAADFTLAWIRKELTKLHRPSAC